MNYDPSAYALIIAVQCPMCVDCTSAKSIVCERGKARCKRCGAEFPDQDSLLQYISGSDLNVVLDLGEEVPENGENYEKSPNIQHFAQSVKWAKNDQK